MKRISVVFVAAAFLTSCGGSEQVEDVLNEVDDVVTEEVIEEEAVVLEDKEYELNELYKLNATLEDPEVWVGEKVKVWFVLAGNTSTGKVNDEPVHSFGTVVDAEFDGMRGGKITLLSSTDFYNQNPDFKMAEGDTVHAIGIFDYTGFDEPDMNGLELVNFK